jgi:hypothetical protein
MKGDVLHGLFKKDIQNIFYMEPCVELPFSQKALITNLTISLKGRGNAHKIYEDMEIYAKKAISLYLEPVYRNRLSPAAILEALLHQVWTNRESEFKIFMPKPAVAWWLKNGVYRRLYLLGLTNTEIKACCDRAWFKCKNPNPNLLYYQLLDNPYIFELLPLVKITSIARRYELKLPLEIIRCSDVIHYMENELSYNKSTCCPIAHVERKFKELSTLIKTLCEDFGCAVRYDCIYLWYQAYTEDVLCLMRPEPIALGKYKEPENLDDRQKEAVKLALSKSVSIITGGAGTGKTTIIGEIVSILRDRKSVLITSFTGKAVAKIKQVVRGNIMTLHMVIASREKKPDWLIVDEVSMVPGHLLARVLLTFGWPNYKPNLVLVGDPNQVQPIEPGNLFNELLATNLPIVKLETNYRSVGNLLANNINNYTISKRESSFFKFQWGETCYFVKGGIDEIEKLVASIDENFIIVSPFHENLDEINKRCQALFTDLSKSVVDVDGNLWTVKSRVMMLENNYEIGIMNGDEGTIVDLNSGFVVVDFLGERVPFYTQLDVEDQPRTKNLTLSWAITIHKAQGSEWDTVIYYNSKPLSQFIDQSIVYTGISRAKNNLYIVGNNKEVFEAGLYKNVPHRLDNLSKAL